MPERLECEVLQKVRCINTITFNSYLFNDRQAFSLFLRARAATEACFCLVRRCSLRPISRRVPNTFSFVTTLNGFAAPLIRSRPRRFINLLTYYHEQSK